MSPKCLARFGIYAALSTAIVAGCSRGGGGTTPGTAGAVGSAGAGQSTAGATGSAGATSGTAGATGGAGAGTAGATSGAAGATSATAGATGSAGAGTAGTTGTAGAGTAGATSATAGAGGIEVVDFTTPGMSTGCGKAPDLTGTTLPYNGMTFYKKAVSFTGMGGATKMAEYLIALPANYAMGTPSKIGFEMGGYTRDAIDCIYGDCWGFATEGHKANAIVVSLTQTNPGAIHPPQTGDPNNAPVQTGWELSNELENNVAFFKAALADIEGKYCVDTKHIYAAGGSSGGDMAQYLGCWMGDQLRGVASVGGCMANTIAPVAGTSPMAAPVRGQEDYANICLKTVDFSVCKGNVAVIMVHGFEDPHIPWADARITHDMGWMPKNGCGTTNTPDLATVHTTITAGTVIVAPPGMWNTPKVPYKIECGDADGCATDYPVRWCEHSDPGYDNSTHGWPAGMTGGADGAGANIWSFWNGLK
jgi:poly(3-hydroxybutyrate) depolymerase